MKDSNWTLRFNRTSREAFGHDVEFDENIKKFDQLAVFIFGVIVGILIFILWSAL